jgi:hypothetical protein
MAHLFSTQQTLFSIPGGSFYQRPALEAAGKPSTVVILNASKDLDLRICLKMLRARFFA